MSKRCDITLHFKDGVSTINLYDVLCVKDVGKPGGKYQGVEICLKENENLLYEWSISDEETDIQSSRVTQIIARCVKLREFLREFLSEHTEFLELDFTDDYWTDITDGYISELEEELEELELEKSNKNNNNKGEKNMKMNNMFGEAFKGIEMGMIESGDVAMTMSGGIAIRKADGEYVTYDAINKVVLNNHNFVLSDMEGMFMVFPTNDVSEGDIIKQGGHYYYIDEIKENKIYAVNLSTASATRTNLVKEVSITGMSFYSKVVSMMDMMNNGGGMNMMNGFNPMMMMFMAGDKEEGSNNMMKEMFKMQMMMSMMGGMNQQQVNNPFANMFNQQPQVTQINNEKDIEIQELKKQISSLIMQQSQEISDEN